MTKLMDRKTEIFEEFRNELMNISYGMLGNLSDAQDIVQDAYIRWNKSDLEDIETPENYLKTIVSNLCIDQFRSAKQKREEYYGPWLPEPVTDSGQSSPDRNIELHDELTVALLHLLENLSPDQRAIYLLHDVFGYTFSEISNLLDKKPATCRKAAQRARDYIHKNDLSNKRSIPGSQQIIDEFIEALRLRDIEKLQLLLTEDAAMYSDGGGKAPAAPKPILTQKKVSRFLISLAEKDWGEISIQKTLVNNRPGYRIYVDEKLISIWSFSFQGGKINRIYAILNPLKIN